MTREETKELLRLAQEKDQSAIDRLVMENQGLVGCVVKRFENRLINVEREDLFQIGMIGLMKAIERFDLSMDVCFSTYAVPLVMGEIRRFLRDDGAIKVSRSLKETGSRLRRLQDELEKQLGRAVSFEELQEHSGLPAETITLAMESGAQIESLQSTVYSGDGKELLLEDQVADPGDGETTVLNNVMVEQLLSHLQVQEQQLLKLRYFDECTQCEVAKRLGMTQVQVSRTEKKLLEKLRVLM
ncbi:MAG: sigma-70 family RNA polymerase sigma factor [Lachnospiraceae bacterium]|nr:sigma-70 family RNA polymerase sigma factor [Lachnospiraceae bacterium]